MFTIYFVLSTIVYLVFEVMVFLQFYKNDKLKINIIMKKMSITKLDNVERIGNIKK